MLQSLMTGTLCIYGIILLLIVTIASPYELQKKQRAPGCIQVPKVVTIEQVTDPVDHAEGPHWDKNSKKLFFVDIHAQNIYCLNTATGKLTNTYIANGPVGLAVPVQGSPHQLVAGAGTSVVLVTWDSDNDYSSPTIRVLATVDSDRNGTRFNDGKVDTKGRLWAGTMGAEDESGVDPDKGSLYEMGSDFICARVISPVNISNGCAWNMEDDTFYYIDSSSLQIAAYDFDTNSGNVSNKRVIFDLPSNNISGVPDGMTIDTKGNLWVALFNGGHIINVDPVQGRLLQSIQIPAAKVTSLAFGGTLLDILYVTTSRFGLTPAEIKSQPRAGSVFAVKGLGVQGRPANSFALRDNGY